MKQTKHHHTQVNINKTAIKEIAQRKQWRIRKISLTLTKFAIIEENIKII